MRKIIYKILSFLGGRRYKTIYAEEIPEKLKNNIIYILGEGEHLWEAVMICPCGCNSQLHMSLHKDSKPKWTVIEESEIYVSLTPSVWRKVGCKSHFFFKNGFIKWCK